MTGDAFDETSPKRRDVWKEDEQVAAQWVALQHVAHEHHQAVGALASVHGLRRDEQPHARRQAQHSPARSSISISRLSASASNDSGTNSMCPERSTRSTRDGDACEPRRTRRAQAYARRSPRAADQRSYRVARASEAVARFEPLALGEILNGQHQPRRRLLSSTVRACSRVRRWRLVVDGWDFALGTAGGLAPPPPPRRTTRTQLRATRRSWTGYLAWLSRRSRSRCRRCFHGAGFFSAATSFASSASNRTGSWLSRKSAITRPRTVCATSGFSGHQPLNT